MAKHPLSPADATSEDTTKSNYKWPASRLSYEHMRQLTIISNRVKRPINQLIMEAVESYAAMLEHKNDEHGDQDQLEQTIENLALSSDTLKSTQETSSEELSEN